MSLRRARTSVSSSSIEFRGARRRRAHLRRHHGDESKGQDRADDDAIGLLRKSGGHYRTSFGDSSTTRVFESSSNARWCFSVNSAKNASIAEHLQEHRQVAHDGLPDADPGS